MEFHWRSYSLPSEFFKNSVYMISSRLHLKFHQISNWQRNRKCIFYDYSIDLLIFETRVYARWRLEWFVECGHLLDGQQQTIGRRVLIPGVIHKIRSFFHFSFTLYFSTMTDWKLPNVVVAHPFDQKIFIESFFSRALQVQNEASNKQYLGMWSRKLACQHTVIRKID